MKVKKVKKVMKGLQKASKTHAQQAKVLKSVLKNGKKRYGKDQTVCKRHGFVL